MKKIFFLNIDLRKNILYTVLCKRLLNNILLEMKGRFVWKQGGE